MRLRDPSLGIDDVSDPAGVLGFRIVGRPVGDPDLALHVAEKRELILELLRESGVVLDRVEGRAEDLGVLLLEFRVEVAEPATLEGSAGGIGLWIEPENHGLPPVVRERPRRAGVILHGEARRPIAYVQHGRFPPQHPDQTQHSQPLSFQISGDSSYAGSSTGHP